MSILLIIGDYLQAVILGWYGLILLILGFIQTLEWFYGKNFTVSRKNKLIFAVCVLFLAQFMAYKNLKEKEALELRITADERKTVPLAEMPILLPVQERFLELLASYQKQFAVNKLIISRSTGTLYFDDDQRKGRI